MVQPAMAILLGFIIGAGCRAFKLPLPAPRALIGSFLVFSMTGGYLLAKHFIS